MKTKLIEYLNGNNEILNHPEIRKIAGIIREKESLAATRFFGIPDSQVHFLKLPFYETGTVKKNIPTKKDFDITRDIIDQLKTSSNLCCWRLSRSSWHS